MNPKNTESQPPAAGEAAHKWSSETLADISDISQAHWHYEGTPDASQTALCISFPGHRVSCQLDKQIRRACNSHAALVAALGRLLWSVENETTPCGSLVKAHIEQARAALAKATEGEK